MEIKFVVNNPSGKPASQVAQHPRHTPILKASTCKYPVKRGPASVDSSDPSDPCSPKSSRFSCAVTTSVETTSPCLSKGKPPLRRRSSAPSIFEGSLLHSTRGCYSPQKTSYAWRKTMYEYFKSDDEGILSSDDEWWLGSNKPLIEQEPPSGKTRPISRRRVDVASKHFDQDCTHLIAGKGSPQEEETPEAGPRSLVSLAETTAPAAPSSSLTPACPVVRTIGDSPMLKTSDFPALSRAPTNPRPPTVIEECSSRLPPGPWKNPRGPSTLTEFPSLRSTARPQPSFPTTRFICSYSSATTQASSDASTVTQRAKETKRTVADLRDESLKATLPAFKLDDPAFKPQTITMCPTTQHPISELPLLLKSLSHDGLSLPSGRPELEGGPYVAIAFDMEWTISRIKGHENRTAIIQLASRSQVLIVQISSDGPWRTQGIMPPSLVDFLANPQIVKIGVGIRNDGLKLIRDHRLGPKPFLNSFLELSRLARAFSQPDCSSGYSRLISLQQIVADHLKVYLPKVDTRTSDWTKPLNDAQIEYAASDVVATIRVAKQLFNLFEGRIRKADSGLMILQYIESLEPTFERSASPPQPPVPPKQKDSLELPKPQAQPLPKPKSTAESTRLPNRIKPRISTERLLIPIPNAAGFPELKDTAKPPLKDRPRQIKKSLGPAPANRKQWRTIVPASGPQSVEVKKLWVTQPAKFLAASLKPLKDQVSLQIQQAWELWYHDGLSFNHSAKAMDVSTMTIATLIGKMLIHLKLNHLNLNTYYEKRIKARIANPEAFAELRISPASKGDVAGKKVRTKCVKGDLGHEVPQGALREHSQEDDDQKKEPIRPSLSLHNTRPNELMTGRPYSSSFSCHTPTDTKHVVVKSPSLPSFPCDHKVAEAEPIVAEQSSCSSEEEPVAETVPVADEPSPHIINTTPQEVSVMVEASPSISSDKGPENIQESGETQPLQSGKDWFEETVKEEEQMGAAAAEQPSQEAGERSTDDQGTGNAGEEDKEKDSRTRKKSGLQTENFRVDDSEFMKDKSLDDEPLFREDEWERIKQINRKKAQLIIALVEGFKLPQRLRTSASYFQLESEP